MQQCAEMRILKTKNVFKTKLNAITKEIRHKVHNCVKGYEQIPGHRNIHHSGKGYNDSYHVGISLYYSTQVDKWETAQLLDVEVAFLNAPLPKSVYIELPDLFHEYCKSR